MSRFYVSLPLSSVVMGALAGALLNLNGHLGLAGWQWLFLIEGLPAVLLSVAFWVLLPDGPADARWLTGDERAWVLEQIRVDACSGGHTHDVWRALRDPRVLQLGMLSLFMLGCNYAYTFSAPAVLIRLTGWSPTKVGFLIAMMNLLAAAGMVLNALHSDHRRERHWHVAIPFLIIAACYLIGGVSTMAWLAVPALATLVIAHSSLQGPLLSLPATFLKGKTAAAGIAAINTIGILGGFIGPYWMGIAKDLTGDYQHGLLTLTIPAAAAAGIVLWMRRAATSERASSCNGSLSD